MMRVEDELVADLARLYTGIKRRFDREMLKEGASLAQTKLLMVIGVENGAARAADLAARLGLAPRTVTEALDALEREGLIVRTPDPDDRRAKRLAITPAGAAAIAVTEPLRQRLCTEVVSALDPEERDRCHEAIKKMLHLLS